MNEYPHRPGRPRSSVFGALLLILAVGASPVWGASAGVIDAKVDEALAKFTGEVDGAAELLASSRGVLVFPDVFKAGFIIGGEGGEGALRIGGQTVDYYSTAAGSVGLQAGAQSRAVFILFMQQEALDGFRASAGWSAGVDGSVAMVDVGAAGAIDTATATAPIIGFVMAQGGLMANLSLEGSKYTKIEK